MHDTHYKINTLMFTETLNNNDTLTLETMSHQDSTPAPKAKPDITITNPFGTFYFKKEQIITFSKGIVGFPEYDQFALATLPNADEKFKLLQCLRNPELAFIVFPTTVPDALIKPEDVQNILLDHQINADALVLLHIATLRHGEDNTNVQMTLNLKAPVVIDAENKEGFQHVLVNGQYDTQFTPKNLAA